MRRPVSLNVNGSVHELALERRVNSCLSFAVMHERDVIVTVEGSGTANGELHPLQQAFIEHDAFPCGCCTPGQICEFS
jgi:xanthine dehydrogenase YagT iron-sulfur-binding subunit